MANKIEDSSTTMLVRQSVHLVIILSIFDQSHFSPLFLYFSIFPQFQLHLAATVFPNLKN